MITHKKVTEILRLWGMEGEKVSDVFYEETGNRNESAFYVGEDYVIKFSPNLAKLINNISISKALDNVGLLVAMPIKTLDGKEYVVDGELYYCLYQRLKGQQLKAGSMYTDDYEPKARYIGEVIGHLSKALVNVEALVKDVNIYEYVMNWAVPKLKDKINICEEFFENYVQIFGGLYHHLPRQIIHRDPNPGNIILVDKKWGFIDFELSERNIRIFDPCYTATAILSESFEEDDDRKVFKWIDIYKNIIYGYDDVVGLTCEEKKAIPYVILSNQLIALAWFAEKEKYQDLYEINKKMTEWIIDNFSELLIE